MPLKLQHPGCYYDSAHAIPAMTKIQAIPSPLRPAPTTQADCNRRKCNFEPLPARRLPILRRVKISREAFEGLYKIHAPRPRRPLASLNLHACPPAILLRKKLASLLAARRQYSRDPILSLLAPHAPDYSDNSAASCLLRLAKPARRDWRTSENTREHTRYTCLHRCYLSELAR